MDVQNDFPILNQTVEGKPLIYLDSAATTQKPQMIIDSLIEYYSKYNANIHRGVYQIAEKATVEFEAVRDKIKLFINSNNRSEIIFTKGATESINLVAYSWGRKFLKSDDEILITQMEHHSNNVPWQLLAKSIGGKVNYIPINNDGILENFESYISEKTKLVAITHQSNVLGTINPIKKIISYAHKLGVKVLVDGAQSTPHFPIDVKDLDCDFFVFSGHKMLAPTGVGVLYGKKDILNQMDPFLSGGEMIDKVSLNKVSFNILPWKFEAGTPNIAQVIGLGKAIDYINNIGLDNIDKICSELTQYALNRLSSIKDIIIYGNAKKRGPVISFNITGIHPYDLSQLLDQDNICIRVGHHCAQPIMKKYGINSSARISFYIYNTKQEIDILISKIEEAISVLR